MNPVRLNGNSLTLDELRDIVVDRRPVMLEAGARKSTAQREPWWTAW